MRDLTWSSRELPILEAVVAAEEEGGDLHAAAARAVPSISDRDLGLCLVRLAADGYLDVRQLANASGGPAAVMIRGARPRALREVGLWPRPPTPPEQKRARRLIFMERLFRLTDGESTERVQLDELRQSLGWSRDDYARVLDYLMNEDLVDVPVSGFLSLTHPAVVEMEEAMMEPDQPTEHFPPISVVVHGDVTNSQIQVGTRESQQSGNNDGA